VAMSLERLIPSPSASALASSTRTRNLKINNLPTLLPLDCQIQAEQKQVHYFFLHPLLGRDAIDVQRGDEA
jgi:hypothetical protein